VRKALVQPGVRDEAEEIMGVSPTKTGRFSMPIVIFLSPETETYGPPPRQPRSPRSPDPKVGFVAPALLHRDRISKLS
jgi:hypothetical protein